jgi:hypothetical protein
MVWKHRWKNTIRCINDFGGKILEYNIESAASVEEVEEIEEKLNKKLPQEFRDVLINFSKGVNIGWKIEKRLQEPYQKIFSGACCWDLERLVQINENKDMLVKGFEYADYPNADKWYNSIAFMEVQNGDVIILDLNENPAPVVYLSHELDYTNGYKLGENFVDFIDKLSKLAFIGPEDWQLVTFIDNPFSGLNAEDKKAEGFRELIRLSFDREISDDEVQALIYNVDPLEERIIDLLGNKWERKYEIIIENIKTKEQSRNIIPAINGGGFKEQEFRESVEKSGEYKLIKFIETVNLGED